MYGEEVFLEQVEIIIKGYENSKSPVLKEIVINTIKELGKTHWIDEELIQDKINQLC